MIEYTLLNVLVLELKIYCGPDKFYERSKFGQYDEVKKRAPLLFLAIMSQEDVHCVLTQGRNFCELDISNLISMRMGESK